MMAFNPFQQMPPSLKVEDATNTEALRLLASSNFLTGGPPLQMPQVPVEGLRAMLPNGFPFPLVYPGLPQDFKPEFLTAGGGPMPFLMEGAFGFHPYAGLDGSRRKNATRETTAPLKEWLNSHRTNPYPTKQEKILLAVMTKMTLTQVSTWFANARRRLKKENGGNCSIKRREEGEDDDDDMAELDRPSSSASNISCGSNIKEEAEEEKEHSVDSKLEGTPTRENLTPKKKMLLIEDILGVKDKKQDDEVTSSKKDSPSSEESGPVAAAQRQFAAFQHMMAMYAQQNPQQAMLAAQMAQQSGRAAFFPFSNFPMMSMAATAAAMPTTPTGAGANGSFTSEATSASPSSCPSTSASKESSPQPKSPKNVKYEV